MRHLGAPVSAFIANTPPNPVVANSVLSSKANPDARLLVSLNPPILAVRLFSQSLLPVCRLNALTFPCVSMTKTAFLPETGAASIKSRLFIPAPKFSAHCSLRVNPAFRLPMICRGLTPACAHEALILGCGSLTSFLCSAASAGVSSSKTETRTPSGNFLSCAQDATQSAIPHIQSPLPSQCIFLSFGKLIFSRPVKLFASPGQYFWSILFTLTLSGSYIICFYRIQNS